MPSLLRSLADLARSLRPSSPQRQTSQTGRPQASAQTPAQGRPPTPQATPAYPGDFLGIPEMVYAPTPDGRPDPGEIVWVWVPFEEDASQGKDRPVLVLGRDLTLGPVWLLVAPLTSKDHDRDADQERRAGRDWVDIGTGDWDVRCRPSEVRINRIVRVSESSVRREGAVLERERFELVATAIRSDLRRQRHPS